jgi:hypothetical protein
MTVGQIAAQARSIRRAENPGSQIEVTRQYFAALLSEIFLSLRCRKATQQLQTTSGSHLLAKLTKPSPQLSPSGMCHDYVKMFAYVFILKMVTGAISSTQQRS